VGGTTAPRSSLLQELREKAQAEVLGAEEQLRNAKEAHARAVEKLSHVQALLALESGESEMVTHREESTSKKAAAGSSRVPRPSGPSEQTAVTGSGDKAAVDAAAGVLEQAGRPMHYREIHSVVERNGVLIRSTNPPNALLTRMLRDGRFKPSSQRGFYELAPAGDHHHYRATKTRKGAA